MSLGLSCLVCEMGGQACFVWVLGRIKNVEVRGWFLITWPERRGPGKEGQERKQVLQASEKPQRAPSTHIIIRCP